MARAGPGVMIRRGEPAVLWPLCWGRLMEKPRGLLFPSAADHYPVTVP